MGEENAEHPHHMLLLLLLLALVLLGVGGSSSLRGRNRDCDGEGEEKGCWEDKMVASPNFCLWWVKWMLRGRIEGMGYDCGLVGYYLWALRVFFEGL